MSGPQRCACRAPDDLPALRDSPQCTFVRDKGKRCDWRYRIQFDHIDPAADRARRDEVIPWLRSLGFRPEEAKRGASICEGMADASLEDRVQCALAGLGRARFERSTQPAS